MKSRKFDRPRSRTRRWLRKDKGHVGMYRDFEERLRHPGARPFYPGWDVEPSCRLMLDATSAVGTRYLLP